RCGALPFKKIDQRSRRGCNDALGRRTSGPNRNLPFFLDTRPGTLPEIFVRPLRHVSEKSNVVSCETSGGIAAEQRGIVFQMTVERIGSIRELENEIELPRALESFVGRS